MSSTGVPSIASKPRTITESEERGTIALAFGGTMRLNLSEQVLRDTLLKLLPSGKWMLKRA